MGDVGVVIEGSEEKGHVEVVGGYGGAQLGGKKGDGGQMAAFSSGVKSKGNILWNDGQRGLVVEEKLDDGLVAACSSVCKGTAKV